MVTARSQILIVEDEEMIREVYRRVFRDSDCILAPDGLKGLRSVQEAYADTPRTHTPYDLIITDCNMPGMDGLTLLEKIKPYDGLPPRIMIAGGMDAKEVHHLVRMSGGLGLIEKPTELAELRTIAKELLATGKSATLDHYFAVRNWER